METLQKPLSKQETLPNNEQLKLPDDIFARDYYVELDGAVEMLRPLGAETTEDGSLRILMEESNPSGETPDGEQIFEQHTVEFDQLDDARQAELHERVLQESLATAQGLGKVAALDVLAMRSLGLIADGEKPTGEDIKTATFQIPDSKE